jgi:hypothetical protein
MGLLGVARANTAVGVSPETFLLLLQVDRFLVLERALQGRRWSISYAMAHVLDDYTRTRCY